LRVVTFISLVGEGMDHGRGGESDSARSQMDLGEVARAAQSPERPLADPEACGHLVGREEATVFSAADAGMRRDDLDGDDRPRLRGGM